jgi:hypothetical protein
MPGEFVIPAVAVVALLAALALVVTGLWRLLRFGLHLFAFPGVVVHEFAHASACRAVGVPVLEVVYFRFGNPPGYVRHANPARYRQSVVISVAPFLVNTVVAFGSFLAAGAFVATGGSIGGIAFETAIVVAVLGWIGLSVGMHAFPSTGDARTLWVRSRKEWRRSPIVLLGVPVVALIYVVNLLSWLWAHVIYSLGLLVGALYLVSVLPL